MSDLAIIQLQRGQVAQAEALIRRTLDLTRAELGPLHPDTIRCLGILASLLISEQQFAEAEPIARECYDNTIAAYPAEHPPVTDAVGLLVDLYEGWERPAQAALWRSKLPTTQPTEGAPGAAEFETASHLSP